MYRHQEIEKKWQQHWETSGLYRVSNDSSRPKYYILDMFPYPSGAGLHVGHPKGYIATDVLARLKMMQGYNVLHPMGFDAFGLPAENYALKNKVQPRVSTAENVKKYKEQLAKLGFTYDWSREINTTDPSYYKWTQWIFLQMFKRGLAYESEAPINWCPSCQTGLANEDLEGGACERCGTLVEQKPLRQWVLKITDYADRLLTDLEQLPAWNESIKEMQRNWLGKSQGAELEFSLQLGTEIVPEKKIKVFTTRLDTIFGCTYVVLAPEHPLVATLKDKIDNQEELANYLQAVKNKTNLERTDLNKDKTGVRLVGVQALNPFNQEAVAVFVADYVLASYGTGAVMAVPAHDERDYEFAQKFNLTIRPVISPSAKELINTTEVYTADGYLHNSGAYSGLSSQKAREQLTAWLEEKQLGSEKVNFKIEDWVFSRQRYWGEPIPLIHCQHCGVVPVPEEELPLVLPEVASYEPTGTGESPLAAISDWVNTQCPKCGGQAQRETNTMPQWAGSCWYYLRYLDPHNDQALVAADLEKYWSPVDVYVGGAEHATRHLIYARFWHKFLFDEGLVSQSEPFKKLQQVGLIMGEDGRKMSKRWGNVINPDEIVNEYGADSLRVYEMFMGPFGQASAWSTNGLSGCRKFLEKVVSLSEAQEFAEVKELKILLHKTIKKVEHDIENFAFNTAISALMILVNELLAAKSQQSAIPLSADDYLKFLQILSPFAPHLSEELAERLELGRSIFSTTWPAYDESLIAAGQINLVVQVNGKLRGTLTVAREINEAEALALAQAQPGISRWLADKELVKVIYVPGRLLNLVIK